MTLQISCPCGKGIQIRDEHAGMRVKCPFCGCVQTAPTSAMPNKSSSTTPPERTRPFLSSSLGQEYAAVSDALDNGIRQSGDWLQGIKFHVHYAFCWDLRPLSVLPNDQTQLAQHGVTDPTLQRYLCWRRSVLIISCAPVILLSIAGMIDIVGGDNSSFSGIGRLWLALMGLLPFAMPIAVITSLLQWSRLKQSRQLIGWGWIISFLGPILLYLLPGTWLFRLEAATAQDLHAVEERTRYGFATLVFFSLSMYLPVFMISIAFGVQRACLRLKTLLPESTLPGLLLAIFSPVISLVLLPFFVFGAQIASHPFLIIGMVLVMGAPLVYLVRSDWFTRPLMNEVDFARAMRTQEVSRTMLLAGIALMLLYAWFKIWDFPQAWVESGEIFKKLNGKSVLGLTEQGSFFQPWDWTLIRSLVLEPYGRSLFTTILVADWIMKVNTRMWTYNRQVTQSPQAERLDSIAEAMK